MSDVSSCHDGHGHDPHATSRAGVVFTLDPDAVAGVRVVGASYNEGEIRYLAARLEGDGLIAAIPPVEVHKRALLTIYVNRRMVGRYQPSAQALADYVACAIRRDPSIQSV